jgi:hypothetical protein
MSHKSRRRVERCGSNAVRNGCVGLALLLGALFGAQPAQAESVVLAETGLIVGGETADFSRLGGAAQQLDLLGNDREQRVGLDERSRRHDVQRLERRCVLRARRRSSAGRPRSRRVLSRRALQSAGLNRGLAREHLAAAGRPSGRGEPGAARKANVRGGYGRAGTLILSSFAAAVCSCRSRRVAKKASRATLSMTIVLITSRTVDSMTVTYNGSRS